MRRAGRIVNRATLIAGLLSVLAPAIAVAHGRHRSTRRPHVADLDVCVEGRECDYGAAHETFKTWGNVPPKALGDCTFAAAADWEQIVLGVHTQQAVIASEFEQAGGNGKEGLSQDALWSYWEGEGIAGVRLTGLYPYTTDRADVEEAVRTYKAMIVELSFSSDHHVAEYKVSGKLHDAVVDGFTPRGPLLVSWGRTLQMTWLQWAQEAQTMWRIQASPTELPSAAVS
jgi:hypothetical protein